MINETLTELREMLGLSQELAAKELNVSRSALGYYERGERQPDATFIVRAARYYGVTSDYLLGLSRNKTATNQAIAEKIPLSDTAINFLSNCSDDILATLSWIISAPSVSDFLAEIREYVMTAPFMNVTDISDEYLDIINVFLSKRSDEEKIACVDALRWDRVTSPLHDIINEIQEYKHLRYPARCLDMTGDGIEDGDSTKEV